MDAGSLAQIVAAALGDGVGEAEPGSTEARILDGALEEFAAHGIDAGTVDGVAERAGVGRVTVFRQFGTKDNLVQRLVARELRRFMLEVQVELDLSKPHAERVVDTFLTALRAGQEHPLVVRLARSEPGRAMEWLAAGEPSPFEMGRAFVRWNFEEAASRGEGGPDAPEEVADMLVRLTAMYVLFPPDHVDLSDRQVAADFARRALAPLVQRRP